jgi:LytS/YehU family sensor histidine kinase
LTYHYQLVGLGKEWTTLNYLNNQVNFSGLEHGSYILHVYAKDANGQKSNVIQYEFSVEQPIWMAWWFYLGISVLAIALVILFYKKRFQIQQKKAEQINELNASKLTAIQSQMNPHFIFNSLNSIQDLVIQGDTENSYTFITKFANLIRKTLNYSDKDFIDFEQEIQLLELYLGLEKLRFKDDFDFEIDTDDIADILIPPMLIQPFIENALVHGLLHKEGHKQLSISFELNEHLSCTIIDNGVGREKAKEIKQRQKGNHESFAVQAIKKRFNILREKFKGDIGFKYEDLLENEVIRGTKVVIHIPIKRQF